MVPQLSGILPYTPGQPPGVQAMVHRPRFRLIDDPRSPRFTSSPRHLQAPLLTSLLPTQTMAQVVLTTSTLTYLLSPSAQPTPFAQIAWIALFRHRQGPAAQTVRLDPLSPARVLVVRMPAPALAHEHPGSGVESWTTRGVEQMMRMRRWSSRAGRRCER